MIVKQNKILSEYPSVHNLQADSYVIFISRNNTYRKYSNRVIKYFPLIK